MSDLRLAFCSHAAAKHAVMRWHYSRAMPAAKLVRVGVWEDDRFVGVVLYGSGANRHLASPFGLKTTEGAELVRVALAPGRVHPTSKCLAISIRLLRQQSPGLKVIVSYADEAQNHVGTVYQAAGWVYLGATSQSYLRVLGKVEHPRSLYDRYGAHGQSVPWLQKHVDPRASRVPMPTKHKYVLPLDKKLRAALREQALPYPKKSADEATGVAAGVQPVQGGSIPTRPLQSSSHA